MWFIFKFGIFGQDEQHSSCLFLSKNQIWRTNLLPLQFVLGVLFNLELLFRMINSLPTVYEAVKESYEKQTQTLKASSKKKSSSQPLEEEDGANASGGSEDQAMTECAACEETYSADDGHLWIGCDHCERWFHGRCVGMTPEKAEEIEHYMCPGCSYKSKQNKVKAPRQVCGDDS